MNFTGTCQKIDVHIYNHVYVSFMILMVWLSTIILGLLNIRTHTLIYSYVHSDLLLMYNYYNYLGQNEDTM